MPSLSWYVYRLRRMSAAELCYRAMQMSLAHASRLAPHVVPRPRPAQSAIFIHLDAGVEPAPYVAAAERIVDGRHTIFDLEECALGSPPNWNRDPLTGREAPLRNAATLDYRDERIVGNIKYLWEPSRHLHLPTLAQAYALTGDERYAAMLRIHIESWIEQCPPDLGVHWASSLELAIRLINWSIAWQLLGGHASHVFAGEEGAQFRDRWLQSVYLQTRAITRRLSRFSSANNHLIGETAGVWIASTTWDHWPHMRQWGERCKRILEAEMLKQNAPDGANREQAFSYQQFVLDFGLLAGLAARAAQRDFPAEYWRRLEAMIDFLACVMDVGGNVPMVGDADDGYVTRLQPESRLQAFRSLIATGAVLFDRPDLARKAGGFDDKSRWLLGHAGQRKFDALLAAAPLYYTAARAFPHAGYYLLGDRYETPDEVKMLVDAGPLGYLSIAAHGHADALSVALSVGGEEVLVDPGTYAYHTSPEWRRYFRGTRAHNTVLIDDRDQSDQSGNFMWSRHANTRCLEFIDAPPLQRFAAEHDGYRALHDPVTHRREIEYDATERRFKIVDTLECLGAHTARWHWHCGTLLHPIVTDRDIILHTGRHRIRLHTDRPPTRVLTFRGGSPDEGGWISRGFGRKEPTFTVAWEWAIEGRAVVTTYICVEQGASGR
jgi:hypothetical protein